jgi:hypothetical protein
MIYKRNPTPQQTLLLPSESLVSRTLRIRGTSFEIPQSPGDRRLSGKRR